MKKIAIIGASGAIGSAFVRHYAAKPDTLQINTFARQAIDFKDPRIISSELDFLDEASVERGAAAAAASGPLDLIIVATGLLHDAEAYPEKSLKDINGDKMRHIFDINTIGPSLVAKHFLPRLHREKRALFAALSARVGSISDNRLGGWHAYRASKAALNMLIKNWAIEIGRRSKEAIIVGLHPGTVDSQLSKPFQGSVTPDHLFTADYAAECLARVMEGLKTHDSGKCFAYDGTEILP